MAYITQILFIATKCFVQLLSWRYFFINSDASVIIVFFHAVNKKEIISHKGDISSQISFRSLIYWKKWTALKPGTFFWQSYVNSTLAVLLREMKSTTRVQIPDKTVCILCHSNPLGKGMNLFFTQL